MDRIWGERRFFVPGIVFLAVLALSLALSGTFGELGIEGNQAGLAVIAAVLAGGIAGYPLGLLLYVPFGLVWRWPIGNYNRFVPFEEFCRGFLSIAERAVGSPREAIFEGFRRQCENARGDPAKERRFYGYFYERFAPNAVRRPAEGRWETMHTIGGMASAIIFGLGLSVLVVHVTDHRTPWWDDRGILVSVICFACVVLASLAIHGLIIAHEAGEMERQWFTLWLDLARRRPDIVGAAAVEAELGAVSAAL